MSASCEISNCGVLAIGRCSQCGRAFCQSHQVFVAQEGTSVGAAGPFSMVVSRSANRFGIAECLECEAATKTQAARRSAEYRKAREERRAFQSERRAQWTLLMERNYELLVARLFATPQLVEPLYVTSIRDRRGREPNVYKWHKNRLHYRYVADVVRAGGDTTCLLINGRWSRTEVPRLIDREHGQVLDFECRFEFPEKESEPNGGKAHRHYRGLVEDRSLPNPESFPVAEVGAVDVWFLAQDHGLTPEFPHVDRKDYWAASH